MKRHLAFAWFLSGSALMLIPFTVFLKASASNSKSTAVAAVPAHLGDRATVHAEGRSALVINLADGREVLTTYAGTPEAQRLLGQNLVQPLAMASSDFDEDGVQDLVSGYAAPNGGMLTLHRGNVDAIYPNAPEARHRKTSGTFTDAPFLSPARAFETPRPVDFIECGDFDADGHYDIVTAARASSTLFFFPGDGRGNLSAPIQVELPGRVTAMVAGAMDRDDGLTDLVVGISGAGGPKALVFEASEGALGAIPDIFTLSDEATSLVLGQFDDDSPMDLAIASGRELMIVRGQTQTMSLNETNRARAREASIDRRSFPFAISSLAVGDFTGHHHSDLAILAQNGTAHILSRPEAVSSAKARKSAPLKRWLDEALPDSWPQARRLARAHSSSMRTDNLVVIDSKAHQLQLVARQAPDFQKYRLAVMSESLDVDGEPIAVLPMRLNADAQSDLVILRRNEISPSVVITAPAMTIVVSTTSDSLGLPSLRQAIIDANANAGADLITFNIGGGGQQTLDVFSELPAITDSVTIDGTTQPGFAGNPIIEVNGLNAPSADGLIVTAPGTTIRGLVINRFSGSGISISMNASNAIVERNFIGTSITGNAGAGNSNNGVVVDGALNARIGGTAAAASNLISDNSEAGVAIINNTFASLVQGNFIGTNAAGSAALGNGNSGVAIGPTASNNSVGGTTAGARNVISGNIGSGVFIFSSASGILVQGNLIGADVGGTAPLPNTVGVTNTSGATGNTIGGTSAGAGNTIAFNVGTGVLIRSGSGNGVLSNSIFSNGSLGIDISDDLGVTPNDVCDTDIGPNSLQNFPTLTSASSNGASTTVTGVLDSTAGGIFRVEFFSSSTCDPSAFGQGQTFIGSTVVSTPACTGSFNVVLAPVVPGQVITATATSSFNETSEFSQCVTVIPVGGPCTISCPPDFLSATSANASSCGTPVFYPLPTTTGACFTLTCAPPQQSVFAVGTTTVNCSIVGGPSCSFTVTIVDETPPRINCPTGFTAPLPAGQLSAVVNYPAATATDNCAAPSVVCVPPSGSTFPPGATLVTCTATDAAENSNRCFFFVTVLDAEAPVIRCPANVSAALPSGQTSAVVNYPAPTVTDNQAGVNVVCSPASGSSFPAGATTVTCTATDSGGNKSSCSFIVGVGAPQVRVTIPGNKTSVEFAAAPTRKPPKPKNNPCTFFTVENIGFAPLILTLDSIARTGSAVDSGRITDPNDTRFFSLSAVNADGLSPLDIGRALTLQPGQGQSICAKFAALIPALAGKTTGLAASNVLPDVVTSKIVFRQNAGPNVAIPILARVSTGLVLVNLSNPRALPEVLFTKSGNDITVSYAVFDSNLDVSRAKYEFLDSSGQVVAGPFEIDLAASISSANLVRGQSFSVDQKFTGASSNPDVTGVRLTVFDGEASMGAPSPFSATSISAASVQLMKRVPRVRLYLPDVKLR